MANIATFQQKLDQYATVILRVGVNLQPGQRVIISASLDAAPLVRSVTRLAYQHGARLVDVLWNDGEMDRLRIENAAPESLSEVSQWRVDARYSHFENGDAVIAIRGDDPDLFKGLDAKALEIYQRGISAANAANSSMVAKNATPWLVVGASSQGWADKVFPDLPEDERVLALWEIIFETTRINMDDPVAAWQAHVETLGKSSAYLNAKKYNALKLTAPGTDLTIGLPAGHIWRGGSMVSQNNITFVPNLPTEEVFTLPDRARVDGVVKASKPLSYKGILIEDFSLTFRDGKVIDIKAAKGEATLKSMIETDEGAARLGEIALAANSSPISNTNRLFYMTLFDENAASHIALGRGYRFTLDGGTTMSDDEFADAGGNTSLIHTDFMIGSGDMQIDGVLADGSTEPIMRQGEWAFEA